MASVDTSASVTDSASSTVSTAFLPDVLPGFHKRFPVDDIVHNTEPQFDINTSDIVLLDQLARGAYGVVYKGLIKGRTYAVKMLDMLPAVEEQINIYLEITLMKALPHERLVSFYGASYILDKRSPLDAKIMLVMELCERGALRECINMRLSWVLCVQLAQDIIKGIAFLHEHGIVHRDIKTTNILVTKDWRAKVCDFSFACHVDTLAKHDFIYGTDEFMSPEIALGEDFGTASDIFSFGILLCELLTGREPSATFLKRQARDFFALPEEEFRDAVIADAPESLEALAIQCCERQPENRLGALDVVDWLQSLFDELGGSAAIVIPQEITSQFSPALMASPAREGTVQYPKTQDSLVRRTRSGSITPFSHRKSNSAGDISSSPLIKSGLHNAPPVAPSYSDMNSRISYLELQLQELRAENKSLTRGLNGLIMFVEDLRKVSIHPASPGSSLINYFDGQKNTPFNYVSLGSPITDSSPRSAERRKNIFSYGAGGSVKSIDRSQGASDVQACSSAVSSESSGAVNLAIHIDSPKLEKVRPSPPSGRPPKPALTVTIDDKLEIAESKTTEPEATSRFSKSVPGMMKLPGIGSVELGKLKHVQQKPKEQDQSHENEPSETLVQHSSPPPPPPPPPPPLNKSTTKSTFNSAQLDVISVLVANTVRSEVSVLLDDSAKKKEEHEGRLRVIIDEKIATLRAELISLMDQKIIESLGTRPLDSELTLKQFDRSVMESSLREILDERFVSERELLIALINESVKSAAGQKLDQATSAVANVEISNESNVDVLPTSSFEVHEPTPAQEAKMNLLEAQLGLIISKLESLAPTTEKLDPLVTDTVNTNTDIKSLDTFLVDRDEINKRISQTMNFQLNNRQTESAEELGRYSYERSSQHSLLPDPGQAEPSISHKVDYSSMSRSKSPSKDSGDEVEVDSSEIRRSMEVYSGATFNYQSRGYNFDSKTLSTSILGDHSESKYLLKEGKSLSEYNQQFLANKSNNRDMQPPDSLRNKLPATKEEPSGELAKLFSSYLSAVNKCEDIVPNNAAILKPPSDQQYNFGPSTPNRQNYDESKSKMKHEVKDNSNGSRIPFASPERVKTTLGTPSMLTKTGVVPSTPLSASSTWKNVGSEARRTTDFRSPIADHKIKKLNQIGTRGTPKEKEADSKLQQNWLRMHNKSVSPSRREKIGESYRVFAGVVENPPQAVASPYTKPQSGSGKSNNPITLSQYFKEGSIK